MKLFKRAYDFNNLKVHILEQPERGFEGFNYQDVEIYSHSYPEVTFYGNKNIEVCTQGSMPSRDNNPLLLRCAEDLWRVRMAFVQLAMYRGWSYMDNIHSGRVEL